jgi:hypothetical protein
MLPVVMGVVPIMVMMSSRFRARGKCQKQRNHGNDSTHTVFLRTIDGKAIAVRSKAE